MLNIIIGEIMSIVITFLIFILLRGRQVFKWRSQIRCAVDNYNFNRWQKYHKNNSGIDYLNSLDKNDVLLYFNECYFKFWTFGKYSMMNKEYIEILKPYFD